ncbi:hypothetical protein T4D_15218 [Trichinella pseudospiralis]|uniref:Uncharacterized protein n=1 Tax=Trichinella pseudospiralis TaxID=6337 RepID=A0A0V1DP72_TRIPS|nr:hypothetical protein T4D_15218 [Trichinella pseudospiralis]
MRIEQYFWCNKNSAKTNIHRVEIMLAEIIIQKRGKETSSN